MVSRPHVLSDCRCTRCGADALAAVDKTTWADDTIVRGGIVCSACRTEYDVIWGTPFLGHYESEDVLGLLEIAANARSDNAYAARAVAERLEALLERYDRAPDKIAFVTGCADEFVHQPWFENRYTEYRQFAQVAGGVDFDGREALDVAAGTGYDVLRLVRLGARVTAVEYNPMLVARGRGVVPEARWVGGFAHALPFVDETFDVVCCNAALHHVRDVPAAVEEMLRVLRPGGTLLTAGDPFRGALTSAQHELDVFDRHPAVLLGVNESIPPAADFVRALVAHSRELSVSLHVELPPSWSGIDRVLGPTLRADRLSLALRTKLLPPVGGIAMRARVHRPIRAEQGLQQKPALRAGAYAEVLDDYSAALRTLLPLLPQELVDRSFPGERQTKFELLNGWRKPQPRARDRAGDRRVRWFGLLDRRRKPPLGAEDRVGYRRARWFLTRPEGATQLRFEVTPAAAASATLAVTLDADVGATVGLAAGRWTNVTIPVREITPAARFVCELEMLPDDADNATFDEWCFVVRGRRFL
jgi:SAM-dependent methyltransferase